MAWTLSQRLPPATARQQHDQRHARAQPNRTSNGEVHRLSFRYYRLGLAAPAWDDESGRIRGYTLFRERRRFRKNSRAAPAASQIPY
jgi:hypothetical protein